MANTTVSFFTSWQADQQQTKEQMPDIGMGLGDFYQTMMKEGALTHREKELIAFAISLATRSTPCINLHVQGCLKAGATREQILEAAGVAVMMQEEPAYVHEVLRALDHLLHPSASLLVKGTIATFWC